MITSRIQPRTLSTLCERVGVAFDVGLDPHRVFDRESKNSNSAYGRRMESVATHVKSGGSLADAVKAQGNYFPDHFAEMIEAGEATGRLDRVLERLSTYYHEMAEFRAIFMNSILWPLVQLVIGIMVVGLLIYLPAVITGNDELDLLGAGLVGTSGLVTYSLIIGSIGIVVFCIYLLAQGGYLGFTSDWAARLPKVGKTFAIFPEARFVQTLALGIEAGMDAGTAIDLAFRTAGTPRYRAKAENAKDAILQGRDMHSVLGETELFQQETIEAVQLGEESGRLAETLDKHFRYLKSEVKSSMARITYVASGIIWFIVAAALIAIIFRVFSLYVNNLGDSAEKVIHNRLLD